jgi:hypothetical protein
VNTRIWLVGVFAFVGTRLPSAASLPYAVPVLINATELCGFYADIAATPGYLAASPGEPVLNAAKLVADAYDSIPISMFAVWNISEAARSFTSRALHAVQCSGSQLGTAFDFHPYSDGTDGAIAAPRSHTIAYGNGLVSVVHWHLEPNYQEPYHTHVLASLTYLVFPAGRTYFDEHGVAVSGTGAQQPASRERRLLCTRSFGVRFAGHYNGTGFPLRLEPQEPEWFHSIQNTDDHTYQVIRIFVKPQVNISYAPHLS